MTTPRIGVIQRGILRSLRDGASLFRRADGWVLVSGSGYAVAQSRDSCAGLVMRGLIERVPDTDRVEMTDEGRQASG